MLLVLIKGIKRMFGLGFLLLSFFSCEKSINYQLNDQSYEVVMYAFPMPDSIVKVHGSQTTNILSLNDYEGIEDLNVSVLIGDNEVTDLSYPFGKNWFEIHNVRGEENANVKIVFTIPNGDTISANTTIPIAVPIVSIDTSRVVVVNSDNKDENMLRCVVEFNDPSSEENYYQIRVDSKIEYLNDTITTINSVDYVKEDKVFLVGDDESVLLSDVDFEGTFNDFLFDGNNYKVKFAIPEQWLVKDTDVISNKLSFYLFSLTADYYKYIRSSIKNVAYREYPFSEKVNIYSNVDNGLGIVAGLSVDIDSISIFN